jgi:hypothetical protein
LRLPLFLAATIYFLIDDVVLAAVRPIVARLAALRLFARLGEAIERLPPYPTLVLFLVPFVVLEPFKLWALWLLGTGRFASGAIMLAVSHLASIVLVERLFHATRDKLLTIPWFARIHGLVVTLYDWSLGRLRATAAWRLAAATLHRLRETLRLVLAPLRIAIGRVARGLRRIVLEFLVRIRRTARD